MEQAGRNERRIMRFYFAPMEGITGYIYRREAWKLFPDADKVYAPFIQPNTKRVLGLKERRDLLPENNTGIPLVPQVLTNHADGFIRAGRALEELGYREINLNLGCPSGTVVSKGKGAGMLENREQLLTFLETVFREEWTADITIKTRLGMSAEEGEEAFGELLAIFRQFPIRELIIHPRYREDFYRGEPRQKIFRQALAEPMDICYNGNVFSIKDYEELIKQYPEGSFGAVMIGRGLLANPALIRELQGGKHLKKEELKQLHDRVLHAYRSIDFGERNTLFKLKELWNYWGTVFEEPDRYLKKIRKANTYTEYLPAVNRLFEETELTEHHGFLPYTGRI